MNITKSNLFGAIADLVQALIEYGCEYETIIYTLEQYGFTREQVVEWYGLDLGEQDDQE